MLRNVVSTDRGENRGSWCEVLQEEIGLVDLNVESRLILKWILNIRDCRVWILPLRGRRATTGKFLWTW